MSQAPPKAPTKAQGRYLLAALFLCGASTLILEIVGTRVISPYYGSSLYTWSALITVTLIALAAGYNLGGRWADRDPSLTLFARLVTASGAATALVPILRAKVLEATGALGVQLGALASAMTLMAPALVLLGTLTPLAVKLRTQAVATVGKSAGDVYAVSTLGSVLGAVLAGFALIPHLPISRLLYGLALLLALLGCLGSYLSQLKLPAPQLAAAAAAALLALWPRHEPETNVRLNKDSPYGQIKVLDFNDRRYLLVNGTTQSMAMIATLETDSEYAQALEWAALVRPQARRALLIGVGAGLLSGALERHYGLITDLIDIDPEIVSAARTYFGLSPRGDIFIEDGRAHLERAERRYDLLFIDAFGAELPPYHLFTVEAFAAARRRLNPGGALAVNIVSLLDGPGSAPWRSAYRTLSEIFPVVRAFQASEAQDGLVNVLLFASDSPLEDRGAAGRARAAVRENVAAMLARELIPGPAAGAAGVLMRDDYAPMEYLMARTAVQWRRLLQERVPSVLLY